MQLRPLELKAGDKLLSLICGAHSQLLYPDNVHTSVKVHSLNFSSSALLFSGEVIGFSGESGAIVVVSQSTLTKSHPVNGTTLLKRTTVEYPSII
jgi:hypothetical protein